MAGSSGVICSMRQPGIGQSLFMLRSMGYEALPAKRQRRPAQSTQSAGEPEDWMRLSAGDGTKGPRLYDWAYVELADLEADEDNEDYTGLWTRGLLIRRSLTDQDLAFFSTWCPVG